MEGAVAPASREALFSPRSPDSSFGPREVRMGLLILLILLAIVVLWMVGAYNALIALKNQVVNAWRQIDVQLKRRHDLIPNLVNTVKGSMDFERSTLEAVIAARQKAVSAQGVAATAKAEGELSQALGRLFALSENYPVLKSSQNVLQLQEELSSTENKIGFARQLYNDVATQYNTKQAQFPTSLVAGMAKASPAELWEIEDAAERAVPAVDLSLDKPKG
jgi:LemA protein